MKKMVDPGKSQEFRLDLLFLKRVGTFVKSVYPKFISSATLLTILLMSISVLDQFITYFVGLLPSEFYVALGHRDLAAFQYLVFKSLALVVTKGLSLAAIKYSASVLYLNWRDSMVRTLHSLYFPNIAYYKLNVINEGLIDNPDQRMTQDVEKCCRSLAVDIMATLVLSPFVIAYYTYKTYASSGYIGPLAIYGYFIAATIINKVLLSPIVSWVAKQEKQEGNFRYNHVSIRSHSEAIGFYDSGVTEGVLANSKLNNLIRVQQHLINWQFILNFSMRTADYFGGMLSYFIIALPIFVFGTYDKITDSVELTGIISQNSFFYMYLINCFSTLIDLSGKLGDFAGTMHRVVELLENLTDLQCDKDSELHDSTSKLEGTTFASKLDCQDETLVNDWEECEVAIVSANQPSPSYKSLDQASNNCQIHLENVNISIPGKNEILIRELNLQISSGTNLLISGPSGSGKSSILRVIRGLWKCKQGNIIRSQCSSLYLPQKAYIGNCGASIRQIISYPLIVDKRKSNRKEDERILEIIEMLNLGNLLDRYSDLDTPIMEELQETLSPGELQRLQLSRVLFHKPSVCFLDEATSALGFEAEIHVYSALNKAGITFVSIGHRISLKRFHQMELHLKGDGNYVQNIIDDNSIKTDYDSCISLNRVHI